MTAALMQVVKLSICSLLSREEFTVRFQMEVSDGGGFVPHDDTVGIPAVAWK